MLFAAGLVHPSEVKDMFGGTKSGNGYGFYDRNFTEEELLGIEYAILCDSDYFDVEDGVLKKVVYKLWYRRKRKQKDITHQRRRGLCRRTLRHQNESVGRCTSQQKRVCFGNSGYRRISHAVIEALVERCQSIGIIDSQLTNCYQVRYDEAKVNIRS